MDLTDLDTFIATLEHERHRLLDELAVTDERLSLANQLRESFPPKVSIARATQPKARQTQTAAPTRRAKGGIPGSVDFEELAKFVRSSGLTATPLYRAIVDHFDVTIHTARWRVKEARRRGILERIDAPTATTKPPDVERPAPPTAPTSASEPKLPANTTAIEWDGPKPSRPIDPTPPIEKVYRCECGAEHATENELAKHTTSHHGRAPRMIEQTRVAAA